MTRHPGSILLAVLLALVGCERACGEAHDVTETIGQKLVSVDLERQLGEQMAAEFRREVPLVDDPVVQRHVEELGSELVAHASGIPDGMQFEFAVIDAPDTVNAVAMPGGYIYIFSGLLHAVESEAELVGVLAHEIAHVAERHVVAQLITSLGIHAIRSLALGEDSGELARLVTGIAAQGALGAFSRTAEREADELGLRMMAGAGWDPRGYATFFDRLSAAGRDDPGLVAEFTSSHPNPDERARRARELAAELDVAPTRDGAGSLRRITDRLAR